MPERSGLELAKHFQDKSMANAFIIMMSSLNIESMVIESISNGAIDFLQKPFEKDDLLKSVEKMRDCWRIVMFIIRFVFILL